MSDVELSLTCPSLDGMEKIECRPHAKVPIVKMWDPELRLACDMNVNNTAALNNTKMMKAYVRMDHRVRSLAMIVKYWTRRRLLNDAGKFHFEPHNVLKSQLTPENYSSRRYTQFLYLALYDHQFFTGSAS